jgi:hypothetical protein
MSLVTLRPEFESYTRRFPVRRKVSLTREVLVAYVRVRWSLWRKGFPATLSVARQGTEAVTPPEGACRHLAGRRLASATVRVLDVLPSDSRCLTRSLVLTDLLAKRGIDSSLVIGVAPAPDFAAHAWVELDGEPLLPPIAWQYSRLVEL